MFRLVIVTMFVLCCIVASAHVPASEYAVTIKWMIAAFSELGLAIIYYTGRTEKDVQE